MRCVCIIYIHDSNYIKLIPIKSRRKEDLLEAYQQAYKFCEERGYKSGLHKLDNKTSEAVESFIASQQVTLQHTPPDMHRTNPAERAIQTWKAAMKLTGLLASQLSNNILVPPPATDWPRSQPALPMPNQS